MPEPTIDAQRIDHARKEISRLVGEIEQLADHDFQPSEFYVELVRRAHVATASEASSLWIVNAQGMLNSVAQVRLADTRVRSDESLREFHDDLLKRVLESGKPCLLPPNAKTANDAP